MTWRAVTDAVWLVLAVLAPTLVVISRRTSSPARFTTVLQRLLARPAGRVAVIVGWMWLGWHAFAR